MSTADEIAKLAQLRQQGVLTDEAFEAEKRSVLAKSERASTLQARQQEAPWIEPSGATGSTHTGAPRPGTGVSAAS